MSNRLMQTQKQKIGILGENIAVKHLVKLGHEIILRNYRIKLGEIDIISHKDQILHFVEVKTQNVTHETDFSAEENIHFWKRRRLKTAIRYYFAKKNVSDETQWQIDIIVVLLNFNTKKAKIRMIENILL